MTSKPKSTSSPIVAFLFRPDTRQRVPAPKWCAPLALIACSLILLSIVFGLFAGSRVPDASTGHVYRVAFGKGHRYFEYWEFIVYEAAWLPAAVMIGMCGITALLYKVFVKSGDDAAT